MYPQNHRIVGVGRDLCGSSSPTPCRSRVTYSRLHRTLSRRVLNTEVTYCCSHVCLPSLALIHVSFSSCRWVTAVWSYPCLSYPCQGFYVDCLVEVVQPALSSLLQPERWFTTHTLFFYSFCVLASLARLLIWVWVWLLLDMVSHLELGLALHPPSDAFWLRLVVLHHSLVSLSSAISSLNITHYFLEYCSLHKQILSITL